MAQKKEPIYVLNSFSPSMITDDACVIIELIDPEKAKELIQGREILSYVGHEATAQLLSVLLEREVKANRGMLVLPKPDSPRFYEMIALTLSQRLPEGQVIKSKEELQAIKFQLYRIRVMYVEYDTVVKELETE